MSFDHNHCCDGPQNGWPAVMLQLSTRNLKKVQKLALAEVRHVIKGGSSKSLLLAGRSNVDFLLLRFYCSHACSPSWRASYSIPEIARTLTQSHRSFSRLQVASQRERQIMKGRFLYFWWAFRLSQNWTWHCLAHHHVWWLKFWTQGAFEIPSSGRQPMFFNPIEVSLRSALWVCECWFGRSLAVLRRTGQYCTGDTHGQITFVSRTSTVVPAYSLKQEQLQLAQASFRDLQSTASPAPSLRQATGATQSSQERKQNLTDLLRACKLSNNIKYTSLLLIEKIELFSIQCLGRLCNFIEKISHPWSLSICLLFDEGQRQMPCCHASIEHSQPGKVEKLALAEVRHVIKGGSSKSLLLAGRSNVDFLLLRFYCSHACSPSWRASYSIPEIARTLTQSHRSFFAAASCQSTWKTNHEREVSVFLVSFPA